MGHREPLTIMTLERPVCRRLNGLTCKQVANLTEFPALFRAIMARIFFLILPSLTDHDNVAKLEIKVNGFRVK